MFIKLEREYLKEFLQDATERLDIWCPWITEFGTSMLLEVAKANPKVEITLYFRLVDEDILSGMLDLKGLHSLIRCGRRIRFFESQDLHAKIFLADRSRAIVGSNNLTQTAFNLNYEIAVYSEDCDNILDITRDWNFREVFAAEIWAKCEFLEDFRKTHPETSVYDEHMGIPNDFKRSLYSVGLRRQ